MSNDETKEATFSINFSEDKQYAILGHLLNNDNFYLQAKDLVQPEWFMNPHCSQVLKAKNKFHEEYKRPPSIPELKSVSEFFLEEELYRNKVYSIIELALVNTRSFGLDALIPQLSGWLHAQVFRKAMYKAQKLFNGQDEYKAYEVIEEATREIRSVQFNNDTEESFGNFVEDLDEIHQEYDKDALSFGLKIFDQQLAPKAKSGSLLRGDTSLIIASSNTGKTTSLVTTAVYNVKKEKHCLFMVHEGRVKELKEKIWCCMLDCSPQDLQIMYRTPEGQAKMSLALNYLEKYLTFVPILNAGATVEYAASIVRKKQQELLFKTGKGYDLFINDYPAKLDTEKNKSGGMPIRHLNNYVYNYFVQLALENDYHSLVAIQANREASKINAGITEEDRLLTKEDVSEAWGPVTTAANIWTINCSPMARAKNRITFYIDKSRSSSTGFAIVCKSNFSHYITHGDKLGASFYRGTAAFENKIDTLLDKYIDRAIDERELLGSA